MPTAELVLHDICQLCEGRSVGAKRQGPGVSLGLDLCRFNGISEASGSGNVIITSYQFPP